jgi:putative membrane-bound dehydrogenase-like protein
MMTKFLRCMAIAAALAATGLRADPLRVFIRAGEKTHGPNQHDHPRFLADYTRLLRERGLTADGGMGFPTGAQLDQTDVLVIFAADGMKAEGAERELFEKFLKRGGGLVVIHDGVVAGNSNEDADWAKKVQGGAWRWTGEKKTIWHEGEVGVYFVDQDHPITRGVSNWDWKDEVYNRLDMAPDVHVLATSFLDVFNIWPQIWTYEKTWEGGSAPYRCFVSIPGHEYSSFETPNYRAILLRGIAWAGGRPNVDEFCQPAELSSLRYPAGGPTPSAEAVKHFNLHPEFNISVAADENIAEKIMSLDWDTKGRLWVVETPEYPNGRDINAADAPIKPWRAGRAGEYPVGTKEQRKPRDRVSILEDTNGDGIMDKKTVFADGLELPTSVVFYKDGIIVAQAPEILWIRDTDGDGKADKTEVLFTGWGTGDTHAVISNLRWGPDGWIYGSVGYSAGKVYSGDRKHFFGNINAGIYRFRPDGSAIEQVASSSCNTWGCEVAPDNEIFFSTATCGEPINHLVIPEKIRARGAIPGLKSYLDIMEENKVYPPFKETRQPYVQIDWVGQWTAAAGACIYDGGAWPDKWEPDNQYSFFLSEPTVHVFHHEFLSPRGPTYQGHREEGRKETHFLTSSDYWFRPIHSRVGPDGALYVVDFYNQIAVHNDTRGPAHGAHNAATRPDRDHHFTRLYRVQAKEAKTLPPYSFDTKDAAQLVSMLRHPNGWVRVTANRLLTENPALIEEAYSDLGSLIMDQSASPFSRVSALWLYRTLARTNEVPFDEQALNELAADPSSAVRKNVVRIVAELAEQGNVKYRDLDDAAAPRHATERVVIERLRDSDDRVRIEALMAVGSLPASRELANAVVSLWPSLTDTWLQSAAIGAANKDPLLFLAAAFASSVPANLATYTPHLARLIANKNSPALAASFVELVAAQPASAASLKTATLGGFIANLRGDDAPPLDKALADALRALLADAQTADSALPLVARWDKEKTLSADIKPAVSRAESRLASATTPDDERARLASNLVGMRRLDDSIIPAVVAQLESEATLALRLKLVDALGADSEGGLALVKAFPKLPAPLIDSAFGHILKRSESASAFLDLLASKSVAPRALGPARVHRLRVLADAGLARRANELIDQLAGPEVKEKNDLIAKLAPEVEKAGDIENGHKLFTQNCSVCHTFKNEGRALAPNLTGMGAHGAADLLVHVVDPNREVEPNFVSVSIETKDGTSYEGIVERENSDDLLLRDAAGDHPIRKSDIQTRASTGRSLMPEGFEALGPGGLRDLLSYICSEELRFRILDLGRVFTANSSHGLFISRDRSDDTISFRAYGLHKAGDVPFDVVNPERVTANVIVLKGGEGFAKTMPQKIEVKAGFAARRLFFLGGVAGWGYPSGGEETKGKPAARIVLNFAGGATQEIILHNGDEIADHNGIHDVPGSAGLRDWTRRGQIRWFGKDVQSAAIIESISIESYDNSVAPVFFGVTAELAGASPVKTASAGQ